MADGYHRNRTVFEDISDSVSIDALTSTVTPVAAKARETIFVQRVMATVMGAGVAGSTWTVTDTNGTVLMADLSADVEGELAPVDLGANGRGLKEGEGLLISVDPSSGSSGIVTWEGYRKRTGVGAA